MPADMFARALAAALLAGDWRRDALLLRARECFGRRYKLIEGVVERVLLAFGRASPPLFGALARFIQRDEAFAGASRLYRLRIAKRHLAPTAPGERTGAAASWDVPLLAGEGDLCRWLEATPEQMAWLADVHGRERTHRNEKLRQYVYRWIPKRAGGSRLLEIPKARLKQLQRRILADILTGIPPHPNAHGFVKSRGIKDFVAPHSQQEIVMRMDLQDFFLSIPSARIFAVFRSLGYSEAVARLLTGLCTNSVPTDVLRRPGAGAPLSGPREMRFRTPHLPQGAPTSPGLANLCAYRMDVRLTALAGRFGWFYTRYADDLLFSGPVLGKGLLRQFQIWVGAIAIEENLAVNMRKTRIMRRGIRQHAAGLVLNTRPNIPRTEYDQLKAILHNCVKHGSASQNRSGHPNFRAHLLGRLSYVSYMNQRRGARLREVFDGIKWNE